ncbi:MAG TPA: carboxypeptidase-like regulatory domain-containing protein, partial [Terriglobia bacterium]|nr:carboxypeptidase-like regulatory domain-containing protein [Terriglobia bacterium]
MFSKCQVNELIRNTMKAARRHCYIVCLVALVGLAAPMAARPHPQRPGPRYQVEGVVRDPSGAVITGAQVVLRTSGYEAHQPTRADGRFNFAGVPAPDGRLMVSAKGFASVEKEWKVG